MCVCACVRNLPLDTEAADLKKQLLRYGAVSYSRLVSSKSSGMFTGSAFIKFMTPEAAQRCIQAADTTEGGVVLRGHQLNIVIAVPPSELSKQSDKKVKEDKRNLSLAKEGGWWQS